MASLLNVFASIATEVVEKLLEEPGRMTPYCMTAMARSIQICDTIAMAVSLLSVLLAFPQKLLKRCKSREGLFSLYCMTLMARSRSV